MKKKKDELARLTKEREFFRAQCDDLGTRIVRLQEEQWRAHRDARRWSTTARIIGDAYRATGLSTPLETVAEQILTAILGNVLCDRAAFVRAREGGSFSIEKALGYWEEGPPSEFRITSPPSFACVSSRTPPDPTLQELQAIIGLPFLLWCFDPASGYGLVIGNRSEANVARAFEESDRPIVEGALNVFLDLREKDRLRREREVLVEELRHRVRNNLQVVYGMLIRELERTGETPAGAGIEKIARRVLTMAEVYDHLLGKGMSRTVNFADYLKALCASLAELQGTRFTGIKLSCHLNEVFVDIDTVTTIGMVVAELVSNSYEHAFPEGRGSVLVALDSDKTTGEAVLTISDDGRGFVPEAADKRRGLGLVRRLVAQVQGQVEMRGEAGTTWILRLPAVAAGPR
jgi:two-component sensor histidine kinase